MKVTNDPSIDVCVSEFHLALQGHKEDPCVGLRGRVGEGGGGCCRRLTLFTGNHHLIFRQYGVRNLLSWSCVFRWQRNILPCYHKIVSLFFFVSIASRIWNKMVDIRIRIISPHPFPLLRKCASTPWVQSRNRDADLVNADFRDLQTIPNAH